MLCIGPGSEGAYSVESDWESCSSHSSGAPSSPETCDRLCPSPSLQSLPQHHHQHHRRQQQSAAEPEEEVMFYHSTQALWDSLAYITNMTEMCDVVFHVGQTRQPVYGVKCLLSVRSRWLLAHILYHDAGFVFRPTFLTRDFFLKLIFAQISNCCILRDLLGAPRPALLSGIMYAFPPWSSEGRDS